MSYDCVTLVGQLGALFTCEPRGEYTRIRTPFLYPDGDVIDIFLDERASTITLTDLGETSRWLRTQTPSDRKSPRQRRLIEDVCLAQGGVEFYREMLMTRVAGNETLAAAATRLIGACIRVADVWFTMRTRSAESTADEVADFLAERAIPFDRSEKHVGRSGKAYTVDFHTRTPERSALVYVLSTGAKASARPVVEHVVTAWHDLHHLTIGAEVKLVSLFDDTVDVWTPEDFRLLESLSELAWWSRPDSFEQVLRAA